MSNWFDRLAIRMSASVSRRRFLAKSGTGYLAGLFALFAAGSKARARELDELDAARLNERNPFSHPRLNERQIFLPIERRPILVNSILVRPPRERLRLNSVFRIPDDPPRSEPPS